jgi:hypothetical protein
VRRLLALVALLVAPSVAASGPGTFAVAHGQVLGLAQGPGAVAWLEGSSTGCRLRVLAGGTTRTVRYADRCPPAQWDVVLAGTTAAWGGYEDVRCSETTAAVYAGTKLVQEIPGDCLGYGTAFQGLASDGRSFFYSLLTTTSGEAGVRCANGGPCRWRLAGGKLVRVHGGEVSGLPPAALIAGAAGRLALVQAAAAASASGRGPFDWPRAAADGHVDVRDTATGRLVRSFRPHGVVRAIALSSIRPVVLVESGGMFRIEWYDSDSGERLGAVRAPRTERLSTDGRLVAYTAGGAVHVLDLETGTQRIVGRGATTAASVLGHRILWGDGNRILEARA